MNASWDSSIKVERVIDWMSALPDHCTAGGPFLITGQGFGDHEDVPNNIGVYLHGAPGTPLLRVMQYLEWKDTRIKGFWPGELSGPQTVFVEVADGSAVRGVFYSSQVVPSERARNVDGTGSQRCGEDSAAGVFGGESQWRVAGQDSSG